MTQKCEQISRLRDLFCFSIIILAIAATAAIAAEMKGDIQADIKRVEALPRNPHEGRPGLVAFPGAEGFGRFARGGRGGDVYHVTTLADSGPGSLREGVTNLKRPRTIVFDVGGTIALKKELRIEHATGLTIAGQTAPGEGICLRDQTLKIIKGNADVVVRYLRVRLGDDSKTSDDAIDVGDSRDVILDHVDSTWGVDGNMDTEFLTNFTMQWCIFGWGLHASTHHKGPHAMLMSFRKTTGNVTIHHNLLASSRDRHPSLGGGNPCSARAIFDFRNNVIYNWEGPTNIAQGIFSVIGNYYRPGPNTKSEVLPLATKAEIEHATTGWYEGNAFDGHEAWTRDNYSAMLWGVRGGNYSANVTREEFILKKRPVEGSDIPATQPAAEAYGRVLNTAGASLHRDALDERIIQGVRERKMGRIDHPSEMGGWPELKGGPAPVDTDRDGIPDAWETAHSLDPNNPEDRNSDRDGDGYTNLEEYLNSLCPAP